MLYRTDSNGNLIKIAGNTNGTYGGNSLPVGSIFSSAIPQTSTNYHLLNGDSLSISGIYSGFYNLINTLVSQGYNLTCTANEYAEDIAKTGNCGKFVINTGDNSVTGTYTDANSNETTITVSAESFKLPTITMFIQGLSNLTNIGDSIQAGLPNITGSLNTFLLAEFSGIKTNGALTTNCNSQESISGSGTGRKGSLSFDASKSSSIYGNSSTVQPASTQYPYYIVLISGSALSIEANPTLSGSEQNLNSIGIGGVNYKTKVDYSTDEVDTGVKWIDGKPIYRKVFELSSNITVSNSSWTDSTIEIASYNIDNVVDCKVLLKNKAFWNVNVAIDQGLTVKLLACRDGNGLTIDTIILEYTKSTT